MCLLDRPLQAVLQALERGEDVKALVRDASKLKAPRTAAGFTEGSAFGSDKLDVTVGSVTNKADVDKVFESGDVTGVVVALGGKTSDVGATMLQDGTANIIAAMKEKGVKKISVVTTIGAGDSMDQAPWAFRLLMMVRGARDELSCSAMHVVLDVLAALLFVPITPLSPFLACRRRS